MNRWTTAIGGFGFIACFALAAGVYGSGAGRQPDEIVAYYAVPANRLAQIGGFLALSFGLVLFALFLASARALVAPREPWSSFMVVTGISMLTCLLIANTLWASSAFTSLIENGYVIDPRTHLLVEDSGFTFLVAGGIVGAGFVAATSLATHDDRRFPRWLAWLGLPVALALLAVYWYLPLFAFFVWVATVSLVGARTPQAPA